MTMFDYNFPLTVCRSALCPLPCL